MSYCDIALVRTIGAPDSSEVRDAKIKEIRDNIATGRLNSDIQTEVKKERVSKISGVKTNEIDGSNTTFYLEKTHDSFRALGDRNDDGVIDRKDVKAWAIVEGEKVEVDVAEIVDPVDGVFKAGLNLVFTDEDETEYDLDPLPSGADLYVSYKHAPADMAEPNSMVEVACAQLTAAYCYSNIETEKLKNFTIGDVTIRKQSQGFSIMMDQYTESIRRIVNREVIGFEDNENVIEDVITRSSTAGRKRGSGKNPTGRYFSG